MFQTPTVQNKEKNTFIIRRRTLGEVVIGSLPVSAVHGAAAMGGLWGRALYRPCLGLRPQVYSQPSSLQLTLWLISQPSDLQSAEYSSLEY